MLAQSRASGSRPSTASGTGTARGGGSRRSRRTTGRPGDRRGGGQLPRRDRAVARSRRPCATSEARFRGLHGQLPGARLSEGRAGSLRLGEPRLGRAVRPARPEELIGRDDFALWPEETARAFRESDRRATRPAGLVEAVETVGDRHYMSLKFPLELGGRLLGGMTLDITDRVQAERRSEQEREAAAALADSMPQIVWAARPDGYLDYYNRRWFEYTGLTAERSRRAEGWEPVLHPDDLRRVPRRLGRVASAPAGPTRSSTASGTGRRRLPLAPRPRPAGPGRRRARSSAGTAPAPTSTTRSAAERGRRGGRPRAKDRFLAVPQPRAAHAADPDPAGRLGDAGRARRPRTRLRPTLEMIRRNVELEARLIDDLLDVTRIVRGKMPAATGGRRRPRPASARPLEICRSEIAGEPACGSSWTWRPRTATSTPTRRGSSRSSGT